MSKGFDFDDMPIDPLEALESRPASPPRAKQSKPKEKAYTDALADVSAADVSAVTGQTSRTAGRYRQITFRIPQEFVDLIDQAAAEIGASKEDTKRWLVGVGLLAYRNGERPELGKREIRSIKIPDVQ